VYIMHEREFIRTGEQIYKIGRTSQLGTSRASQYSKGSRLMIQKAVINARFTERIIIQQFTDAFEKLPDLGREYFQGNYAVMEALFLEITKLDIIDTTYLPHQLKHMGGRYVCITNRDGDIISVGAVDDIDAFNDSLGKITSLKEIKFTKADDCTVILDIGHILAFKDVLNDEQKNDVSINDILLSTKASSREPKNGEDFLLVVSIMSDIYKIYEPIFTMDKMAELYQHGCKFLQYSQKKSKKE
jgi:hypothetical protein